MPTSIHPTKRIFLVFEGGGAKGIVHVGALRALEEHNIQITGVAGTSAGAIVAALVAAGYSSRELVAEDGTSPLLALIGLARATEFFGSRWRVLALLRGAAARWWIALPLTLASFAGLAWLVAWLCGWGWAAAVHVFVVAVAAVSVFVVGWLTRGIAQLKLLADRLNLALARKLGLPDETQVLFRHLEEKGRPPLRIVATDLVARKLKLFSGSETPEVRVADAVAASGSLPFACSPHEVASPHGAAAPRHVDKRLYIDGGIVSNLPAWTFDEERALDPDAVTVAISIDDGPPPAGEGGGTVWFLLAILRAAMFGRRHLETRGAPRLLVVPVPTDIRLIDFDLSRQRAAASIASARAFTKVKIEGQLFVLPQRYEEACRTMIERIDARATPNVSADPDGPKTWRTRALVARRDPGASSSWRVQFGAGLVETDADDQILLPENASVIGHAVLREAPILQAVPFSADVALEGAVNRYRRALVRKDLKWCLAIPIYRNGAPEGRDPLVVLAIDSDLDVKYFNFDATAVLTLEAEAETLLRPVVDYAAELNRGSP